MSNVSVLPQRIQQHVRKETDEFLQRIKRSVDTAYVHLDVQPQKEQTRNIPAYRWRVLLVTNRGRYYADDWSFGAVESLKQVYDKIEQQIEQRLGRIDEQYKSVLTA